MDTASAQSRNQIGDDLWRLGVLPGGVLMVHSSFKSLGPVPGGIETVIAGLLEALGPTGTLLMPGLCWEQVSREHPIFPPIPSAARGSLSLSFLPAIPWIPRRAAKTHRLPSCAGITAKC